MKIVFLIDYFQPKLGYQEYFLAREMKKMGHQVCVITSEYYFPFPQYENTVGKVLGPRKVKTGIFTERDVTVNRTPLLFETKNGAITILKNLGPTLAKIKPDVVISDGVFTPLAFQSAYYKSKIGYKLIYDNHASTFNTELRNSLLKKLYMLIFSNLIMPYVKKHADGFTAIGESERYLLAKEYKLNQEEIKLFPLGADTDAFSPDEQSKKEIRTKIGIKESEKVIIYAGKITRNKDVHILLEAMVPIFQKNRDVKLLIVGGGEEDYLNELKNYIQNNAITEKVIWVGMVENTELPKYLNAADVAVWPGNMTNLILEAMACGLPLILPKIVSASQTSDHLLQNHNGYQFERGDSVSLTGVLRKMLAEEEISSEMSLRSRSLAVEKFSWSKIASDLEKFLELLIK